MTAVAIPQVKWGARRNEEQQDIFLCPLHAAVDVG